MRLDETPAHDQVQVRAAAVWVHHHVRLHAVAPPEDAVVQRGKLNWREHYNRIFAFISLGRLEWVSE